MAKALLGGNGFYWRVAVHAELPSVLEIRRDEGGIRAWAAEPGEYYNSFDGAYGGLWRRSARPPQQAVVVACSEGHSANFILVPEEQLTHITTLPGKLPQALIRADMVFFTVPNGGAVFSVSSITFCGSLLHHDSDNNISRILANVLDRFLDPEVDFDTE